MTRPTAKARRRIAEKETLPSSGRGRLAFAGVAVLAAGVLLAACGSSGPSSSSSGSSQATKVSIATDTFPAAEGNPFASGYAGQGVWVLPAIFNTLTDGTSSGIKPELALSWTMLNPTTWQFQLRKGVKFSDGETFDASTAAFTFNYLTSSAGKQTVDGSNTPTLKSAAAVGPYTLQISTTVPTLDLPGLIDQDDIVAPAAWTRLGASNFALHPVGTGPYKVTQWSANEIYFQGFSGAWQPPQYKTMDIILIPNEPSGFAALQSGEVQVLYDPSLTDMITAEHSSSLYVTKYVTPNTFGLQFLTSPGSPIMNANVRVALNYAVDRPAIVQLLGGVTSAASQGIGTGVPGNDPSLSDIPYDPSKAQSLLAAAGYANGFSLTAAVVSQPVLGSQETLTLLQSELAKVGVHLTYQSLPFAQWLDDFLAGKFPGAQLTTISYSSTPQFDGYLPLSRGSCIEVPSPLWCTQPQGDLLSAANGTTSASVRAADLVKVEADERQDPPAIWLYHLVSAAIASSQVKASMTQIGSIDFATLGPVG
jgi:peptide/nickel transport system substrate-binding protein